MARAGLDQARRRAPEIALAVLAGAVFLGFLGDLELWGKREQRAVAEAIDTIDGGHWLVARIQGRPRLEKPPLPRWSVATLMRMTGRRDELVARLPSALAALGTIGLVVGFGRRIGGRSVGLASGLILTSTPFFVVEMRQAGNDAPLAFFVTSAIYAAWRRLHDSIEARAPADHPGPRIWATLMFGALGLAILTKGPIALMLAGLAIGPYLAISRKLRPGLKLLVDPAGLAIFAALALAWPIAVLRSDPNAAWVWFLEMASKPGLPGARTPHAREVLAAAWPGVVAPWTVIAVAAIVLPFTAKGRADRPRIWLPWAWSAANLAAFCTWRVAKPSYYLPCLPGLAILTGWAWVRLAESARGTEATSRWARRLLQAHWVGLFCVAAVAPVVAHRLDPADLGWIAGLSLVVAVSVVACVWAWRAGGDVGAILPASAAMAAVALVAYGAIGPRENARRGHRGLAERLDLAVPEQAPAIMFHHELDEGLWVYLRDHDLRPIPGTQPRYNNFADFDADYRGGRFLSDPAARAVREKSPLLDWLRRPHPESDYLLIRARDYDKLADDLRPLTTVLHRESGLDRNELILLHAPSPGAGGPIADKKAGTERR